ncbi:hypothetical protein UFOVP747_14 [uncultured Caudovirales phage]|uniref:Major capsid protein n=1 Tax=uncultured Caudovirales phage TaxID=2100421 RepID=A0A6J5NJB8_9CAUD|nr:hypothetical protein UFOVP675_16 [uncultured Caudovirales phage]CAB5225334.1 hypothetical protein UFOVP747_14 [uncultured Caudovirales phage]
MSFQIDTARTVQFGQNFMMLAQQKASRLRNAVMVESGVLGKRVTMDQVGAADDTELTIRHGDTPLMDVPHARRHIVLRRFNWATLVDQMDKLQTIEDPTNIYAQQCAAAMGRRIDRIILDAAYAAALTGEEGTGSVAFPAGQQIAVNSWLYGTGTGNAGLTISKLIEAKVLLDRNEAGTDPDEERYIVCTARQIGNMLATAEFTSQDFNFSREELGALVTGKVDTFMGFKFIRTELVPLNGSSQRRVLAYVKSGLGLAVQAEPVIRISERADKNHSTQIYAELGIGATRVEEAKVAEIICAE